MIAAGRWVVIPAQPHVAGPLEKFFFETALPHILTQFAAAWGSFLIGMGLHVAGLPSEVTYFAAGTVWASLEYFLYGVVWRGPRPRT